MISTDRQRNIAKTELLQVLTKYDGDTKNPVVATSIDKLVVLNPSNSPTSNKDLLQGNWLLINAPNFPDRQENKQHKYVYNLGRLAFNMFQPTSLKVAIQEVIQPVFATEKEDEYTHDIVVQFKTIDDNIPQLTGIIKNLALCHPVDRNTVRVYFTGGELIPANTDQLEQWLSVFSSNFPKASVNIAQSLKSWFITWMFGIKTTSEIDKQTGKKSFTMTKSPKGLLKILYLDEELRITKGNKGTVLICKRQS